ncbi:hypothetical protein [Corynebacterium coyleae]|uniref:hypothetical protein n=1 Tax=Corynebacterium coyleae TaxID=53374 RepID=UPI00254CB94A|nr:hypothetical protein [Corynebacterium coyleae]MDK8241706.1 hypothetical protein [Corynebacterium coyleae]
MKTIDKHDGYTLNRTNHGTWKIEDQIRDYADQHVRIDTAQTFDWENRTTTTEVFVNILSTGQVEPDKATGVAHDIMRATRTAKYFADVIALYENGVLK